MIKQAATDAGISFRSPAEMDRFVELRATAAEDQFQAALAEIPEEEIHRRNRMQRENPAMGAGQWFQQYESQHAEAALTQALEFQPQQSSTTSPPPEA
jgi:hypothetical protein